MLAGKLYYYYILCKPTMSTLSLNDFYLEKSKLIKMYRAVLTFLRLIINMLLPYFRVLLADKN